MTFKTKSAKRTVILLLTLGGQGVISVTHYKYLGILLDTELLMTTTFRDNNTSYFFVPFVHLCTHHNYGVISGRPASRDCMWPLILLAGLHTTCRGDRVLVVIMFNVTFLPWNLIEKKCAPGSWTRQNV